MNDQTRSELQTLKANQARLESELAALRVKLSEFEVRLAAPKEGLEGVVTRIAEMRGQPTVSGSAARSRGCRVNFSGHFCCSVSAPSSDTKTSGDGAQINHQQPPSPQTETVAREPFWRVTLLHHQLHSLSSPPQRPRHQCTRHAAPAPKALSRCASAPTGSCVWES